MNMPIQNPVITIPLSKSQLQLRSIMRTTPFLVAISMSEDDASWKR
jgi:hypothetical protein